MHLEKKREVWIYSLAGVHLDSVLVYIFKQWLVWVYTKKIFYIYVYNMYLISVSASLKIGFNTFIWEILMDS